MTIQSEEMLLSEKNNLLDLFIIKYKLLLFMKSLDYEILKRYNKQTAKRSS